MTRRVLHRLRRIGLALAIVPAIGAVGWACGFTITSLMVSPNMPADADAYRRGELGVVKSSYRRRELLQAYRVLQGAPPLPAAVLEGAAGAAPDPPLPAAIAEPFAALLRDSVKAEWPIPWAISRSLGSYQSIDNCLPDAFRFAAETLAARVSRYGSGNRAVEEWVRGQAAVFRNCNGETAEVVVPAQVPEWADARLRADRAYQTATAYFYGMAYDDAARRFDAIATDQTSEWRSAGAYLAARAFIRAATVPDDPDPRTEERWRQADRRLRATLADGTATRWHGPARRLLTMVAARLDPVARMRELAARMAARAVPDPQDVEDYLWLHRTWFETASAEASLVVRADDLTDWLVATQAGDAGHALRQWREGRGEAWLATALGLAKGTEPGIDDLLAAASRVPPSSKAYPTAIVHRVRLLMAVNRLDDARAVLATLPTEPGPGMDRETINLLEGHRLAVARSLDEFLTHAPRVVIALSSADYEIEPMAPAGPEWDADAVAVLDSQVPLEVLVQAAESTRLPPALRTRVAGQAMTRAVLLARAAEATRAARVLRTLAPDMQPSLDGYLAATTATARHRAGLLLLLRNPRLSIHPTTADDRGTGPWWWCETYGAAPPAPSPPFLSAADRAAAAEETSTLTARPEPRVAFTEAALAWAREAPESAGAPEALARAISGWRYAYCGGEGSTLPKEAFDLLHRRFPKSEWTARTKYWFR